MFYKLYINNIMSIEIQFIDLNNSILCYALPTDRLSNILYKNNFDSSKIILYYKGNILPKNTMIEDLTSSNIVDSEIYIKYNNELSSNNSKKTYIVSINFFDNKIIKKTLIVPSNIISLTDFINFLKINDIFIDINKTKIKDLSSLDKFNIQNYYDGNIYFIKI